MEAPSAITATNPSNAEVWRRVQLLEDESSSLRESRSKNLLGKYRMIRNFNPKNLDREVNAAGGAWAKFGRRRGEIRLFQHLLPTSEVGAVANAGVQAVNLVTLRVLFLSLVVVLRGDCEFLSASERDGIAEERETAGGLSANCVRASFDSPLVRIGVWKLPNLTFRLGPRTEVTLDASYVGDEIRIGKGASGVRFWLERIEEGSVEGDEWEPVVKSRLIFGKKVMVATSGLLAVSAALSGKRIVGAIFASLAAFAGTRTGGIIRDTSRRSLKEQGALEKEEKS